MNDAKWIRWFAICSAAILLLACVVLLLAPSPPWKNVSLGLFLTVLPTLVALFSAILSRFWLCFVTGIWMTLIALVAVDESLRSSPTPGILGFIAAVSLVATPFLRIATRKKQAVKGDSQAPSNEPTISLPHKIEPQAFTREQSSTTAQPLSSFLEVTWEHVVPIWWGFTWRSWLLSLGLTILFSFLLALLAAIPAAFLKIQPNPETIVTICSVPAAALASVVILKTALTKNYKRFSIKLLNKAASSSCPEQAASAVTAK